MATAHAIDAKQTMRFAFSERENGRTEKSIQRGTTKSSNNSDEVSDVCSYVDMLEQQQSKLVAVLSLLYTRFQQGQSWLGEPLREAHGGQPLTHDILERLGLLHYYSDGGGGDERVEEACGHTRQMPLGGGTPPPHQSTLTRSDSEKEYNTSGSMFRCTSATDQMLFTDPFPQYDSEPASPMKSAILHQTQAVAPVKQEEPIIANGSMQSHGFDARALSWSSWQTETRITEETLYFGKLSCGIDPKTNLDQDTVMLNPFDAIDLAMPIWDASSDCTFSTLLNC